MADDWKITPQEWASLREDVGYIRANFENVYEILDDHEERISTVSRTAYTLTGLSSMAGALFGHFVR